MRPRYEFTLHRLKGAQADVELALCGSQGWEIRGVASCPNGDVVIALQRPLDEDMPLPDAGSLAATLEAPLSAPHDVDAVSDLRT